MQTFTDDCYSSGMEAPFSLQAFEDNLRSLKSSFSGLGAPSNTTPGMLWFDMSAGKAFKVWNKSATAWFGIMAADSAHKIWVYRNAAPEGWAIDASVTDVVLALKGGGYGGTGGVTGGTWVQPSMTLDISQIPYHNHGGGDHAHVIDAYSEQGGGTPAVALGIIASPNWAAVIANSGAIIVPQGGGAAHNHGSSYRPAAAIGSLQYTNI
jgi:hypothetical protein